MQSLLKLSAIDDGVGEFKLDAVGQNSMSAGQLRTASAVVLLTALALLVRLWGVSREALWSDEAITLVIAGLPPLSLATDPIDPSGPLYYWLHQLLIPADPGAGTSRAISIGAGTLLIPVVFAIARQFVAPRAALLSAALTAIAFPLVDYSKEARCYALLSLLFALVVLAVIKAARTDSMVNRRCWLASYVVAAIFAIYTHLIAFPFIAATVIALLLAARTRRIPVTSGEAYSVILICILASVPEIFRIFRYVREANAFLWLEPFSFPGLMALMAGQWLPFANRLGIWAAVLWLPLLLAGWLAWRATRPLAEGAGFPAIILALWLSQPIFLWLIGLILSPIVMHRTVIPDWPAFAIALALLVQGQPKWVMGALLAPYAAWLAVDGPSRQKEDWSAVHRAVAAARPDAVIVCPSWKAPAFIASGTARPSAVLLAPSGGSLQDVTPSDGGAWVDPYLAAGLLRHAPIPADRPPRSSQALSVRRLAIVRSQCPANAIEAVVPGLRLLPAPDDHDPALAQFAPTSVTSVTFDRPMTLKVERTER